LAKKNVENNLKLAASKHGVYIPSGALWGAEDIRKMADSGTLQVAFLHVELASRNLQRNSQYFGFCFPQMQLHSINLILQLIYF
jgi:hypothetical protein